MQTFLPIPDFKASASCLDRLRLGKQRVEVKQLLNAIASGTGGWANHPAARMWRGHEEALAEYGLAVCEEWISRGYRDSLAPEFRKLCLDKPSIVKPAWFGDSAFHDSHKSNLLRKDLVYYCKFGWNVPHDLPYVWPI